jgi:hypothetical protein
MLIRLYKLTPLMVAARYNNVEIIKYQPPKVKVNLPEMSWALPAATMLELSNASDAYVCLSVPFNKSNQGFRSP